MRFRARQAGGLPGQGREPRPSNPEELHLVLSSGYAVLRSAFHGGGENLEPGIDWSPGRAVLSNRVKCASKYSVTQGPKGEPSVNQV